VQRFRGFDGVRAIAILAVIPWHALTASGFPSRALGPLRPLVTMGWAGVDLFFALSGFLITTLLLREEAGPSGRFRVGAFYARRALRILPVFYAVFALDALVLARLPLFASIEVGAPAFAGSPLGLIPYATFWGNYFVSYPPPGAQPPGYAFVVFWSLCVEEHFYLLWPLFLTLVRHRTARACVALGVCLTLSGWRAVELRAGTTAPSALHQLSHLRLDSILWGALGALLFARARLLPARLRRAALVLVAAAVALLVRGDHLSRLPAGTVLGESAGLTLIALGSTLLLVELGAAPWSPLCRALEARPLVVLGRLSYAMYLIHWPMLDLARALFSTTPRAPTATNFFLFSALAVALAAAAAGLLHVAIERPFLALKDRLR
jgi:peptidoglycan/LPS O-acetylase OafA/YrhL